MPVKIEILKSSGNVTRGALVVTLSAFCFAAGAIIVKHLALEPLVLTFWRNLISAALVLLWFTWRGWPPLATGLVRVHALRGALTYGGLVTYFSAVQFIPLADAVLLRATGPIFVPIFALLLFRRWSDRNVWGGVALGFLGLVLLVGPSFTGAAFYYGVGLASGVLSGAAAISIWLLSNRETAGAQMLWFTGFNLAASVLPLPWVWQLPPAEAWVSLVGLAATTTASQGLLLWGCTIAPTDKILTWSYTSVVFAAIAGAVFWDEPLGIVAVAGMMLVVTGARAATLSPAKS
jgi:drug/metabolite transporter (DMT)-like permease